MHSNVIVFQSVTDRAEISSWIRGNIIWGEVLWHREIKLIWPGDPYAIFNATSSAAGSGDSLERISQMKSHEGR